MRVIIIGNADEKFCIKKHLTSTDVIIRFNTPNPSCSIQADLVLIANSTCLINNLPVTNNGLYEPDSQIIWRYKFFDIIFSKYQKINFKQKIRYFSKLPLFKKKNKIEKHTCFFVGSVIHQLALDMLNGCMPSSGFLAILLLRERFSTSEIYLHNFSFEGWSGHNWKLEKEIIEQTIEKEKYLNWSSDLVV